MIFIIFFFFISILSITSRSPITSSNTKSRNLTFSEQGFYSISIEEGDKMIFFLKQSTQKLYFFLPSSGDFYIKDLTIDGTKVSIQSFPTGFCIEGNENITLTFYMKNNDINNQVNFWIIPSSLCPKSSSYSFGSNIIEMLVRGSQTCIFSPTFDSKNQKFTIEAGIPLIKGYHYTSMYTTNYSKSDYTNTDNQIQTNTIKTGAFFKYYLNYIDGDEDHLYSIFFRRKTKSKNENSCDANAVTRCNVDGCVLDYIDFVSIKCSKIDTVNIIVAVVIAGVIFLIIVSFIIYMLIMSKKRKLNINSEPLNNDVDNENKIFYAEQNVNDYPQQPQYFEYFKQK